MSNSLRRALHDRPVGRLARFEPLEDRRLLAITVSTLSDLIDGNITPGNYSLREAIANAAPGETINFAVAGTINLALGQLEISKNLIINGPGASVLSINAQQASRVFDVSGSAVVSIGRLTLTGGRAPASQSGGAVRSQSSGMLTIHNSTVTSNAAGDGTTGLGGAGGGVWSSGPLTINNSTISANAAGKGGVSALDFGLNGGNGGGVWSSSTLLITNTHITDNETGGGGDGGLNQGLPGDGGGVFLTSTGSATLTGSTVSLNVGFRRGGGGATFGTFNAVNSTFSGNAAGDAGGGLFVADGHATLRHATVVANVADAGMGGGIASTGSATVLTDLHSSIVAGNTGADVVFVAGVINSFHSLSYNIIGTGNATAAFNQPGDFANIANPLLNPLANNGGPTPTHGLLPASPAYNRGDPAAMAGQGGVPQFDQRGAGFSRTVGRIDVGAYENPTLPQTLTVNTLVDEADGSILDGDISLRDAIAAAAPAAVINFSVTGVIELGLGELLVDKDLRIEGPGAHLLTLDARDPTPLFNNGDGSRAFRIEHTIVAAPLEVTISGLTIAGGDVGVADHAGSGGAVWNNQNLTLSNVALVGNAASHRGGGIYHETTQPAFTTTLRTLNCQITGNSSGRFGGGIYNRGIAEVANSTIAGNSAGLDGEDGGSGGGILNAVGTLTLANSLLTGNSVHLAEDHSTAAKAFGGGVANVGNGTLNVVRSTISGNSATTNDFLPFFSDIRGGGVFNQATLNVDSSTIHGNSATGYGQAVDNEGVAVILSSTISGHLDQFSAINNYGSLTLSFTTVTNNQAGVGGFEPVLLFGSVIANNVNYNLGCEALAGSSYNVIGSHDWDEPLINGQNGNKIGAVGAPLDARLGPLANNGGPTQTHALLPDSPAINAGNPLAVPGVDGIPFNDQRGAPYVREFGSAFDSGAFEFQSTSPSADFDSSGRVEGRDFLAWQRGFGATGVAATNANGNADNDNDVDATDLAIWRTTFGSPAALAGAELALAAPGTDNAAPLNPMAVDAAIAHLQTLDAATRRPLFRKRLARPL